LSTITIPYSPRDIFRPFHARTQRHAIVVAHRQCGKSVATINDMLRRALCSSRPHSRYAYIAPLLGQAKEVMWDYLQRYAKDVAVDVNQNELRVRLVNGASIRLHGADNPDRLRGAYLDGVVMDEFADMHSNVAGEVVRPMLASRDGWSVYIGTPKGKNAFWERLQEAKAHPQEWYSVVLPASVTGAPGFKPGELESARQSMTPEEYEQEFECSFEAAIRGAYFASELADAERTGRIRNLPVDSALPVHTAWDLGIGDPTAIWVFQVVNGLVHVIDHYENSGKALPHYADELARRPYSYEVDWLPHDARMRDPGTGRTRVETLIQLGRRPRIVPLHTKMDGINAARVTLPRCVFDRTKCAHGLEALRQYRADYDTMKKTFRDEPRHDWTSHSADAFRYLAMAWREMTGEEDKPDPIAELLKPKSIEQMIRDTFDDEAA